MRLYVLPPIQSTLLTNLSGVHSEVAAYDFTTLTTVPGVIQYKGAKIQLLDLPGIIEGARDGKGRGRQVIAVARTCSLIYVVLDVLKPLVHKRIIEKELEGFGIRLNKQPPNITFRRKDKGGINFNATVARARCRRAANAARAEPYAAAVRAARCSVTRRIWTRRPCDLS